MKGRLEFGAEMRYTHDTQIVRGATRREGFLVGRVFAVGAFLILAVVLPDVQIERGSMLLPSPKSDGALFIFPGLTGLRIFAYVAGKRVAVSRGTQ